MKKTVLGSGPDVIVEKMTMSRAQKMMNVVCLERFVFVGADVRHGLMKMTSLGLKHVVIHYFHDLAIWWHRQGNISDQEEE